MSFQVFSYGHARFRFHFDKRFWDPGKLIEQAEWMGKLGDKRKVPLTGDSSGADKAVYNEFSIHMARMLREEIQEYCLLEKPAQVDLVHTVPGVLAGVWKQPKNYEDSVILENPEPAKRALFVALKDLKLNYAGYVNGIVRAMEAYFQHWGIVGLKPCGAQLVIHVNDL